MLVTGAGSRRANQSDFNFGRKWQRLGLSDGAGLICSNANVSTQSSGDANTVSLTGAEASNKFVKH